MDKQKSEWLVSVVVDIGTTAFNPRFRLIAAAQLNVADDGSHL